MIEATIFGVGLCHRRLRNTGTARTRVAARLRMLMRLLARPVLDCMCVVV